MFAFVELNPHEYLLLDLNQTTIEEMQQLLADCGDFESIVYKDKEVY